MNAHVTHRTTFISITPRQRQQIEHLVENLISMLDLIDGEADAEPSLGWREPGRSGYEDQASPAFMAYHPEFEDGEEDAGDMPELDQAEDGLGDSGSSHDESLHFLSFAFDGSGQDIAQRLLHERISRASIPVTDRSGNVYSLTRAP